MDALGSQLIWVAGRRYKAIQTCQDEFIKNAQGACYVEEDTYVDDFQIVPMDNDRFVTSYHIPLIFLSRLIGSKGSTKKRIEAETKTQLRIPKPGVEGDVVIIGPTRQCVSSARRKVDMIILAARNNSQLTHFLCVPFTSTDIKDAFIKFRDEVLSGPAVPGLDACLFQKPNKLHLTLTVLSLLDNDDKALAVQIFDNCMNSVITPALKEYGHINLRMHGLGYMNDDPSSVAVLYGKVESKLIQLIADAINARFAEKGLSRKRINGVKIHVTLINSRFRDRLGQENSMQSRQTFDARKILETYENFDFGTLCVTEIHLSQMHSTPSDGFYEAIGIWKL